MARIQPDKTLRSESSILLLKVLDIGLLAIIDADYTLRFLDLDNYRLFGGDTLGYDAPNEPLSTDIGSKGNLWLTAHPDGGKASLYSVKRHQMLYSVGAHHGRISCVRIDPQSRYAVTAGDDGKVAAWELKSAKRLFNAPHHTDRIEAIAFNDDATLMATGGYDRIIQLSKPDSSMPLHLLRAHTCAVTALLFAGDFGLVSGDRDGGLALWNVDEGRIAGRLESAGGKVTALCRGGEDAMLFVATEKGTVALYDLHARKTLDVAYLKLVHPVRAMAYSKKHQCLAVGTDEGAIHIVAVFGDAARMMQVESTEDYETLHRLAKENEAVRFSPLYRRMADAWQAGVKSIDRMIAEDRVRDAEKALKRLRGIKGKHQEVEAVTERLKTYTLFKRHVESGRYNVAYDLAFKNPSFQSGVCFEKMEQHWNIAYAKAAKLLQEQQDHHWLLLIR